MPVYTKATSQTVNNSTTLTTLTGLTSGTLSANTVYRFEALFAFNSGAVPDLKVSVAKGTGLSDATAEWGVIDTTNSLTPLAFGDSQIFAGTGDRIVGISGFIIVGTNPGDFVFQFAQNTLEVSDTTILAAALEVYATEDTTLIGKATDETRTSTTTVTSDGALVSATLAASTVYKVELLLPLNAHTTPDVKYTLDRTGLSDAALYWQNYIVIGGSTASANTFGTAVSPGTSGVDQMVGLAGLLVTGTNTGTLNFQWAQRISSIEDTTFKAGAVFRLVS